MARNFSEAVSAGLGAGYDFASPKKDKAGNTAYQRYVAKFYGPDVTSHRDPLALARAATGAVENGLKSGAGFLSHAAAGLVGMPRGPSNTPSNTTPENRMYNNSALTAGLSSGNFSGSGYGNASSIGSRISGDLQRDFGLSADQAAGIVGNLGHESNGFRSYQENKPIGGGKGGAGWAQWTGSRRTDFENYTKQNNFHPQSYEANYGFLKKELTGPYKGAIDAVKKANTVKDAVYAFEGTYEKANPKYVNYASRLQYANAYTSTDPNLTPAQQAAAAEAAGTATGSLGSITNRGERVAAMQRDLNSRGAKLTVDGLEGPLTRAASQQYYGSPTSVRTPSFTNTPTPPTTANNWSSVQGSPTRTVNQRQDYVPTPSRTYVPGQSSYTSGRGDEGRGVQSPLSAQPRAVPTQSITGSPMPLRPFQPAETARIPTARPGYIPGQSSYTSGRQDEGRIPAVGVAGANAWSSLQQPYPTQVPTVQAPTARIPQARPPEYGPPMPAQQAVPAPPANWTLADIQRWADQHGIPVTKAAGVLSDIGSRAEHAFSEGSRSGMGYSGGNYSGGTYGGAGGRSISSGVGGAFKNR